MDQSGGPSTGVRAVFLVGFMGAGKTSVGQALGRYLGWTFEDLDDRIVRRESLTVAEIFRDRGEIGFREAEQAALVELLAELRDVPRVIGLGGGTLIREQNTERVREAGWMVFLDAPIEELWRRCRQQDAARPLCQNQGQFRQLYESRRGLYQRADLRVETAGKSVEAIAAEVACGLNLAQQR